MTGASLTPIPAQMRAVMWGRATTTVTMVARAITGYASMSVPLRRLHRFKREVVVGRLLDRANRCLVVVGSHAIECFWLLSAGIWRAVLRGSSSVGCCSGRYLFVTCRRAKDAGKAILILSAGI
jgi:uncharacterized membrane protein YccF (DUF307 family)